MQRAKVSIGRFVRTYCNPGEASYAKKKENENEKENSHLHVSLIHFSRFECPATVEMANSGVVKISAVDKGPHNQRQSRR